MTLIDSARARVRTPRLALAGLAALGVAAIVVVLVVALAGGGAPAARADPEPIKWTNPMRDGLTQRPLSCPDPSVIRASQGGFRYFLYCTTNASVNGIAIWKSIDLVHWYPGGWVYPAGRQPSWALPTTGSTGGGLFWGPAIYRIGGRYVLYFSTRIDVASGATGALLVKPDTMVLGVATAPTPTGPWTTRLLHVPGALNAANASPNLEKVGGDIDPAAVRDPRTGRWYLFWAEQKTEIWESSLSPDGLSIGPTIRIAFKSSEPWECDPANRQCVVEGPEAFYHDGALYVLYSGASTWDTSYAVGVARAPAAMDAARPFVKLARPILKSAPGFIGPGGESGPIAGPQGQTLILYHAELAATTSHDSAARVLQLGTLTWSGGWPLIGNGVAGAAPAGLGDGRLGQ